MRITAVAVVLVGCVHAHEVPCDDGRVCPADLVCDDAHVACVHPDQIARCADQPDGAACQIAVADDGICDQHVCRLSVCGDGYRRGDEQCDGADVPADADCRALGFYTSLTPACNDACSYDKASCMAAGTCGDTIVQPEFEICEGNGTPTTSCVDYGYGTGTLGCLNCGPELSQCIPFGWQLTPTSGGISDVHGLADDDVYATVQSDEQLIHYDGKAWTPVDLSGCAPTSSLGLFAVFAPATGVVFAGGSGVVARVSGSTCTRYSVGTYQVVDVWASSATYAWAAAAGEGLYRFDGSTWTLDASTANMDFIELWGRGPSEVWALRSDGVLWSFNGTSWSTVTLPTVMGFAESIWGTSTDLYVGGRSSATNWGVVVKYDGTAWSTVMRDDLPLLANSVFSLLIDGWTAGGRTYVSVRRTNPGQVAMILVDDGTDWVNMGAPIDVPGQLWASPSGTVFAAPGSFSSIARFQGTTRIDDPTAIGSRTTSMVGSTSSEVYATSLSGSGELHHWDGRSWSLVSGVAAFDIDATPSGTLMTAHMTAKAYVLSGGVWNVDTSVGGTRLTAVADDDVWFLTNNPGLMYRWHSMGNVDSEGYPTTNATSEPIQIADIWGSSSTDVFAVGLVNPAGQTRGIILHWNGTTWSEMTIPAATEELVTVWGRSATEVYAIGRSGTLLRYNGTAWTAVSTPSRVAGVWSTSTEVYIATADGLYWSKAGGGWLRVQAGSTVPLMSVYGVGDSVFTTDGTGGAHQIVRLVPW